MKIKFDTIIYILIIITCLTYMVISHKEKPRNRFIIKYQQNIDPRITIIYDTKENKEYLLYKKDLIKIQKRIK